MMKRTGMMLLAAAFMALGGCSHNNTAMQAPLDQIRVMVKQSALLAVQAACAPPDIRKDMIQASVTMARRAMGGPEMAKIHKMMGQMPGMAGNSTSMKGSMKGDDSPEMKQHMALHDAGEDVFDFLDYVSNHPHAGCATTAPASLAAAAALMREWHGSETDRVLHQLDRDSQHPEHAGTPDVVRSLALALARI
ncbi:MAG: hypothetical protein Q9M27_06455 [Mariprofundaceae bacterium]|nr:hypothetical protein [Mariprofundaceae bacterium]